MTDTELAALAALVASSSRLIEIHDGELIALLPRRVSLLPGFDSSTDSSAGEF